MLGYPSSRLKNNKDFSYNAYKPLYIYIYT